MLPRRTSRVGAVLGAFGILGTFGTVVIGPSPTPPRAQDAAPPAHDAAPAVDETAELRRTLLDLAARCPMFDMLGDPMSGGGRELKAMFATVEGRASALRAILPLAGDAQSDLPTRRDGWRLISSILGRADQDDALPALIQSEEFAAPLRQLVDPVVADARELVDAMLANAAAEAPDALPGHVAAEVRAEAHQPGALLPQHVFLIARLGASTHLEALYRRALDGVARLEQAGGVGIGDVLYRGARFPQGSFLWAFGLLPDDGGAAVIVRAFDEAAGDRDQGTLRAALDAMQFIENPDPTIADRVRAIVEDPPRRQRANGAGGAGSAAPVEYGDVIDILRVALNRFVDLGVARYRSSGDLAWLDTTLGWITRPANAREHETLTIARASQVEHALTRVAAPSLWPTLRDAVIPRLGAGHPTINDRSLLWLLELLPKPTEGVGAGRRITEPYERALAVAHNTASARFKPTALRTIRSCGRWAAGTSLEELVRADLRTLPVASQVLAHLRGAAARAELEALRDGGPFQGTLPPPAEAERQRMTDMLIGDSSIKGAVHMAVEARLLDREGAIDPTDPRFEALDRSLATILSPARLAAVDGSRASRQALVTSLRTAMEKVVGGERAMSDEEFEPVKRRMGDLLSFWLQVFGEYDFDWNLSRALEIVDLSARLDSREPDEVRTALADLRRRREERLWEIAGFDVYAWVPQMILVYEQAADRFTPQEATRVRKDILSALAAFRSTIGREFLARVIGDVNEPEEVRTYAAGLAPRRIKQLGDEAH